MADDKENTLLMETTAGSVTIRLRPYLGAQPCGAHQGAGAQGLL